MTQTTRAMRCLTERATFTPHDAAKILQEQEDREQDPYPQPLYLAGVDIIMRRNTERNRRWR